MAFRVADAVTRGEIDNRRRGLVTGRLWLVGQAEPVVLELKGDCRRDLAGCLLTFENPRPVPAPPAADLALVQEGVTGDMTASRKVRVAAVPAATAVEMAWRAETVPERFANCLYLEWYSAANGRVVIESVDCRISVSEPEWTLTAGEDQALGLANSQTFVQWMERLARGLQSQEDETPDEDDIPPH
ncbi:MAG: hypothetical protein A3K19_28200 [Lentisphaerae bacterium RIFOXYB12_FULL_65_16]|nr:MAG: hypothetical protein A3K18_17585 [Lentisphaerae bacterium RIFOXYA12_64_32]OGV85472.1 MAG: hypothetical protein A3K19_28200 [Lentisphaerae bacterium RIFOXYB12_FULL_65_16]